MLCPSEKTKPVAEYYQDKDKKAHVFGSCLCSSVDTYNLGRHSKNYTSYSRSTIQI